jgi:hypothetical protein
MIVQTCWLTRCTFAVLFGLISSSTSGAVIGIDFNLSGPAPLNWNRLTASNASPGITPTPMALANLIAETGAATNVDFRLDSSVHTIRGFDSSPNSATIPLHSQSLADIGGYFHNDSGDNDTVTAAFSQLDPNILYKVWVFVTRMSSEIDTFTTISGTGVPITFRTLGSGPSLFINGQLGSNTRTLDSYALHVQPVATGEINVSWTEGPTATRYTVAGVAIEPVPEPASVALAVCAILAFAVRPSCLMRSSLAVARRLNNRTVCWSSINRSRRSKNSTGRWARSAAKVRR